MMLLYTCKSLLSTLGSAVELALSSWTSHQNII